MHRTREAGVDHQTEQSMLGYWPVPDSIFAVSKASDPTAILKFDLSLLTTGTTRTVTVPDADFTLAGLEIANVFTANQEIQKTTPELIIDESSGASFGAIYFMSGATELASIEVSSVTPGPMTLLNAGAAIADVTPDGLECGSDGGKHLGASDRRWDTIYGRTAVLKPGTSVGDVLEIQDSNGNARLQLGTQSDNNTYGAIYGADAPNGGVNYILRRAADATDSMTYLNGTTGVTLQDGGNSVATFDKDTTTFPGLWLAGPTLGSGTYFVIHLNGAAGYGPVINSPSSQALGLAVNNNVEWAMNASALYPATDNADDIGTSSLRPRDTYTARNLFLKGTSVGTSGDGVAVVGTGTAPTTSPADLFQMYSADHNGAGTATPHWLNEEGDTLKLFKGAALTTQLTTLTHTSPGTPDYAIAALVDSGAASAWGFSTQDEGHTVLSVIANLQTRVAELEARLQAFVLLA